MSRLASAITTPAALYLMLTVFANSGCVNAPGLPVAPSPELSSPASALTLTIGVYARNSETPIEGAFVRHQGASGYTNASGEVTINVEAGRETTVEASAHGYRAMTATGTLNSDERWKFYLEANP